MEFLASVKGNPLESVDPEMRHFPEYKGAHRLSSNEPVAILIYIDSENQEAADSLRPKIEEHLNLSGTFSVGPFRRVS